MEKFADLCKSAVNSAGDAIASVVDGACDFVRGAWNGVKSFFNSDGDIITQGTSQTVFCGPILSDPNEIWSLLDRSPKNGRLEKEEIDTFKILHTTNDNIRKELKVGTTKSEFIRLYTR